MSLLYIKNIKVNVFKWELLGFRKQSLKDWPKKVQYITKGSALAGDEQMQNW